MIVIEVPSFTPEVTPLCSRDACGWRCKGDLPNTAELPGNPTSFSRAWAMGWINHRKPAASTKVETEGLLYVTFSIMLKGLVFIVLSALDLYLPWPPQHTLSSSLQPSVDSSCTWRTLGRRRAFYGRRHCPGSLALG